ncbi:hypothetical protein [Bartonella capreoli]|nr:hypothetical protein [Bartonella capreoli]
MGRCGGKVGYIGGVGKRWGQGYGECLWDMRRQSDVCGGVLGR